MGGVVALRSARQAAAVFPEALPRALPAAEGDLEALPPPALVLAPLPGRDAVQGVDRDACPPARNARR